MTIKEEFEEELKESVGLIHEYISTEDRQWTIKPKFEGILAGKHR